MNYLNRVVSRIEQDVPMVINFDHDEFSLIGDKAKAIGLVRFGGKWHVEVEFKKYRGSAETITLLQYMDNTKDIN